MEKELEAYFDRLWPICRSITGNGLRQSLQILQEIIPLELHEVPTGTQVFDWVIPKEWNINDAYIITPDGRKIADFKKNNLHVLNYSVPVNKKMSLDELQPHLFTLPHMPEAIPYLTSYYKESWGFCITHNELSTLPREGKYEVRIDSSLANGSLTYGDLVLKGETDEEILFSTYVCHPSLANNELSGPLVTAFLYKKIAELKNRRYTYRFVFAPETIGIIAYLHKNGFYLKDHLHAGYVVTCVGDKGDFTYKNSKEDQADVNRVARHVLKFQEIDHAVIDFSIGGSDERQYCSPGFNLPVGSLMRTMYQQYEEYHTSLDNKDLVSFSEMCRTIDAYFQIVKVFELNRKYVNLVPHCEPQLGKRGLYSSLGGLKERANELTRRLHLLSFADGEHDLVSIAEKRGLYALDFADTIEELVKAELLKD